RAGKDPVGRVELRAVQRGGWVEVVVSDDGRGLAPGVAAEAQRSGSSITDVLTRPGFSTADEVTGLAGRGVGLDAVRAHVESLGEQPPAVVMAAAAGRAAICCDRLLGEEEVVVKSLGPLLRGIPGYLGAAILGDGRIALIVEPGYLVRALAARSARATVPAATA